MRPAVASAGVFLLFAVLVATFATRLASEDGGLVVRHDPDRVSLSARLQAPGGAHLLGTDELGRDLAARMIHGARVPLQIGLACGLLSLLVGAMLGTLAGYFGGVVDWVVLRLAETVLCFPFLFLALAAAGFFDPSVSVIVATVVLVSWPAEARIVRGEVLRLRESELAAAATASGAHPMRIVFRHMVPNAIPPAIASASFGVAAAIGAESALSFLGLGVQPPSVSWGTILSSAEAYFRQAWWIGLWPAVAIFLTILSIQVLAEAARDWGDPRSRGKNMI
jgi:peptide/nickel transport system permease protein